MSDKTPINVILSWIRLVSDDHGPRPISSTDTAAIRAIGARVAARMKKILRSID